MARLSSDRPLAKLLDLVVVAAGFASAVELYRNLHPESYAYLTSGEAVGGFLLSVATFWLVLRLYDGTGPEDPLFLLIDQFCLGTGLILIVHAILNYFHILTRSLFLIVIGGLITSFLLAVSRLLYGRGPSPRAGVPLIGFHPLAAQLAQSLHQPILGVLGAPEAAAIPGSPRIGDLHQFETI